MIQPFFGGGPMIISASRRTDIPALYAQWFKHRLEAGVFYAQNPFNPKQIRRIERSKIDGFVFWTRNAAPFMNVLDSLGDIPYYFHYTITPYDTDMETNLPPVVTRMKQFMELSSRIGSKRIIWRYDPIFINNLYTPKKHLEMFENMARTLRGYTDTCVISFTNVYRKNKAALHRLGHRELSNDSKKCFLKAMEAIANDNGMRLLSCSEATHLKRAACIDASKLSSIAGKTLHVPRDKHQRTGCACVISKDIGIYNTCVHGCAYCYATHNREKSWYNYNHHDIQDPLITGPLPANEVACKTQGQPSLFEKGYEDNE